LTTVVEDGGFSVCLWIIHQQDVSIFNLAEVVVEEAIDRDRRGLDPVLLESDQVALICAILDAQSEHAD